MLIGAILISGNWHLAGSLIYWLGLLFCAFAAGCVMLTATAPSTKEKSKPSLPPLFPPATYMPEVQRRGRATVWISLPILVLIAAVAAYQIGKDRGYGIRDRELIENSREYSGITVLSQQSDRQYTMRVPGWDRDWPFVFCHPLKMPADVIDIKYEQRYGCKQVNGTGFVSPHHKEKNDASTVQNGYYPTSATETTRAGLERGR